MTRSIFVFCTFLITTRSLLYVERYTDKSSEYMKITINYVHDTEGNSISNVTFNTSVTLKKMLLYVTMKIAENEKDEKYKITLVRTVADAEKTVKSMQSNMIMRGFMSDMVKCMDFELKFPLPPVKCH